MLRLLFIGLVTLAASAPAQGVYASETPSVPATPSANPHESDDNLLLAQLAQKTLNEAFDACNQAIVCEVKFGVTTSTDGTERIYELTGIGYTVTIVVGADKATIATYQPDSDVAIYSGEFDAQIFDQEYLPKLWNLSHRQVV